MIVTYEHNCTLHCALLH